MNPNPNPNPNPNAQVPDRKIKGTIWESYVKDDKVELNTSELEALFASKPAGM